MTNLISKKKLPYKNNNRYQVIISFKTKNNGYKQIAEIHKNSINKEAPNSKKIHFKNMLKILSKKTIILFKISLILHNVKYRLQIKLMTTKTNIQKKMDIKTNINKMRIKLSRVKGIQKNIKFRINNSNNIKG